MLDLTALLPFDGHCATTMTPCSTDRGGESVTTMGHDAAARDQIPLEQHEGPLRSGPSRRTSNCRH